MSAGRPAVGRATRKGANADGRKTVWLVELFSPEGKSEGWWTSPVKEAGGWRTTNAWAAREYTESEAKAVAAALDYFPSPNRWSHWVATEHIFVKNFDGWQHCGQVSDVAAPAQSEQAPLRDRAHKFCVDVLKHKIHGDEVVDALTALLESVAGAQSEQLRALVAKWRKQAENLRTGGSGFMPDPHNYRAVIKDEMASELEAALAQPVGEPPKVLGEDDWLDELMNCTSRDQRRTVLRAFAANLKTHWKLARADQPIAQEGKLLTKLNEVGRVLEKLKRLGGMNDQQDELLNEAYRKLAALARAAQPVTREEGE